MAMSSYLMRSKQCMFHAVASPDDLRLHFSTSMHEGIIDIRSYIMRPKHRRTIMLKLWLEA